MLTRQCLAVEKLENGAPVVNVACDNGFHNGWTIQNGNNDQGIRLTGTEFCLDAGSNPANNGQAKIWQCYPTLFQQTWWYTDDKHIAITGGDQCLDVGQDFVQTWQCVGGNTNQIWTVGDAPAAPSSSAPPSSSSAAPSSSAPSPSVTVPPLPSGVQIHFDGSSTGCLQVGPGSGGEGTALFINTCATDSANWIPYQLFQLKRNEAGVIRWSGNTELCVQAGSGGAWTNGSGITLQKCNADLQTQQWYYTDDNHVAVVGGSECTRHGRVLTASRPVPQRQDGVDCATHEALWHQARSPDVAVLRS